MTETSNNKKSRGPLAFLRHKKFRIGGYAVLVTILFIAAIVLVNIGVEAAESRWGLKADLSYNSLTKLSDQTKEALGQLDEDVTFYILAAAGSEDTRITEILDRYRLLSPHVSYQLVDTERNPGLVTHFQNADTESKFGSNSVIVSNADNTRFKVYSFYELLEFTQNQNTQQYQIRAYNFERMFTQGLLYVTAERTNTAYIMQGHGEIPMDYLAGMKTLLEDNNYDVVEVGLTDALTAGNTDVLLVLSPQKDLSDEERDQIAGYLANGGNMIYVNDVGTPNDLANFNTLLSVYGVGFLDGMVVANLNDSSQFYPLQPTYLIPELGEHDITTPLLGAGQSVILAPQTRAIAMPEMDRSDFTVTPLLSSLSGSYLIDTTDINRQTVEKQDGDIDGPFPVAVAVQRHNYTDTDKESRVILVGSSGTIASDSLYSVTSNGEFLLSALKWATKDATPSLSIPPKTAQRVGLGITTMQQIYILGAIVAAIPLVVLVIGIGVWLRRRHL